MPERIFSHFKSNLVAYVALFVALGGSSYAAVRLAPGSVHTRALAKGAVTHKKLAPSSVTTANIADRSLTRSDFKLGALSGPTRGGGKGSRGPAGPAGRPGGAFVGARLGSSNTVVAPHQANTSVPLADATWTQEANELDLIAGSMTVKVPSACTGSFGNTFVVSVDGKANTFAVPPQIPASATVTVPIVVGTLTEPGKKTDHRMTASLANSCTKAGEDFTVGQVKLDVLKFN
jgi:hypothetical protein